jgi:fatty-acyl-CoA synthase
MAYSNFRTLVEALLSAPGERPFVTVWNAEDDVHSVTFHEFIRLAKFHAASFRDEGLRSGDRVILVLPQGIPLMAAFAGAMLIGAVPAILAYPNFKVDPAKYSSGLKGVSANLQAHLIVVDEEFPVESSELLIPKTGRLLKISQSLKSPDSAILPELSHEPATLAFIQHSAGTTGLQKGVALSHSAVLTQLDHLAQVLDLGERDRIYSWLPLYHDMGLIACFILPLVYHLPIVMQSPIDWVVRPGTMMQLISDFRCTLAWVPNFALQFLARRVREEDRAQYDLRSLRALINCSEPVRAQSIEEFVAAYGSCGVRRETVKSSYAMAENVFAVTQSDINDSPRRLWVDGKQLSKNVAVPASADAKGSLCLVSSGRCLPGNRVRIVSADGAALPDCEVGEILIQSDSLFTGYYNRPDLTKKAFRDNWYTSGDLGFCMDGELYVIGRKNDLIIVAGNNIYPQDIEEIVCRHPAIHDGRAVAFGLYNADLGTEEIVIAAEMETQEDLRNDVEIERAIRNAIVAELDVTPRAIYLKPPRWIVKSTAGKPARSTTREKLLTEQPELSGDLYGRSEKK